MSAGLPEPWLRREITDVPAVLAQVLYSFRQAVEDLERFTQDLTPDEFWLQPYHLAPVGFHIRHIAGSVDRLLTYALGANLSEAQFQQLQSEMEAGAGGEELRGDLRDVLDRSAQIIRNIQPGGFEVWRAVGRKGLPATVGGLLVHIAEHTQRHVGQAIVTAKVVKGVREAASQAHSGREGGYL
ncbi:MAG TPA: DinB family protein [Bryobacteraceae bacterium]|nr:DinB family protein [Bryobacteraceae bacterium]